jgi:hypothetical protein
MSGRRTDHVRSGRALASPPPEQPPPCLVAGHEVRRRAPTGLVLEIDVGERVPSRSWTMKQSCPSFMSGSFRTSFFAKLRGEQSGHAKAHDFVKICVGSTLYRVDPYSERAETQEC